jgi:uncharacterized membrane protein
MLDQINGLPVHPLVVHAIVVLLPLATLGTIAIVVRPRWRVTYGPLVVAAAALSVVLIPIATSSGEALQERVGSPGDHAELGDSLIWFAIPLLVLSAAVVWLQRRHDRASTPRGSNRLLNTVAVTAVVAALACGVQVVRVGDSGARAAWGNGSPSSSSG